MGSSALRVWTWKQTGPTDESRTQPGVPPGRTLVPYLRVRAVLAVTLAADEHVCLGSADLRQLVFSDGLFGQSLSDLLQLCARHLLESHPQQQPSPTVTS